MPHSEFKASSFRTPSPAATCSRSRRRAPARRSPLRCRSSSGSKPSDGRPSGLVLVPTRELAAQVAAELGDDRPRLRPARGRCLRRHLDRLAGEGVPRRAHPRRHTRPPAGPDRAPDRLARRRPDAHPRRGRPDARHGLPAPGRPDRRPPAQAAPDDVLLGDARRQGRRARAGVHAEPVPLRGAVDRRPGAGRDRPPVRAGHGRQQGRDARGAARAGQRARARLRAHEARRRPARPEARAPQRARRSRCTAT